MIQMYWEYQMWGGGGTCLQSAVLHFTFVYPNPLADPAHLNPFSRHCLYLCFVYEWPNIVWSWYFTLLILRQYGSRDITTKARK